MVDTEVKNRKVNRSKNAKSEKTSKSVKEVINPAVDPRDEVSSETEHVHVCIYSSLSSLIHTN